MYLSLPSTMESCINQRSRAFGGELASNQTAQEWHVAKDPIKETIDATMLRPISPQQGRKISVGILLCSYPNLLFSSHYISQDSYPLHVWKGSKCVSWAYKNKREHLFIPTVLYKKVPYSRETNLYPLFSFSLTNQISLFILIALCSFFTYSWLL